jgi:hypothetical protein
MTPEAIKLSLWGQVSTSTHAAAARADAHAAAVRSDPVAEIKEAPPAVPT